MKRYKIMAVLLLACVMFMSAGGMDANAEDMQGREKENITSNLENGVLTISGKGAIPECRHKKIKWSEAEAFTECEYDGPQEWEWQHNWFRYEEEAKIVIIEEGITSIPAHAFAYSFPNAQTLIIPSTVKSIGHAAFENTGFRRVIMGDGVTSMDAAAFMNCYHLENIKLSKNLKKIEKRTFDGCNLKQIAIPAKVKAIGEYAFKECFELKAVEWEGKSRLKEIGKFAFTECKIKKITIPASVKKIGEFSISGTGGIQVEKGNKKYKSKDGVLFSKDGKTLLCYPAEKKGSTYKIPKGVKTIGKKSFSCWGGFESNQYLKKVIMPDSVTVIKERAFEELGKLKTVRFSKNLKKIEALAFDRCYLTSLKLPSSLTYIGEGAFECDKIKGAIIVPKNVKEIGSWAFRFSEQKTTKKIVVKSKKLKKVSKEIVGIYPPPVDKKKKKKITIILPKSKEESYKKFFAKQKSDGVKIRFVYQ